LVAVGIERLKRSFGATMSALSIDSAIASSNKVLHSASVNLRLLLVLGAACCAVVLFALVPATTRIATAEISGLSLGLVRAVGAGFFALPLLIFLRLPRPQKADWGLLALYALGNFAGFPILFAVGVRHTSGSHAALIMAAMPLLIALIAMVLEGRLPRWIWFAGAAIAVGGETALVGIDNMTRSGGASMGGDSVTFAACALSAVGIVAGARLGSRIGPLAAALWAITIASTSLAPWAAIRLLAAPHAYQALTATTWLAVFQITFGAAVMANVSWLWAVSRGGLVRVAPIQFAQPVCALFFASAFLNEHLSKSLLLLAVSIVLGTVIACRGARPAGATKTRTANEVDSAGAPVRLANAPPLAPIEPGRIEAPPGLAPATLRLRHAAAVH
jgi:drug/metabolite transporter (DMT)-like permease